MKLYEFTVVGYGNFPLDMLRYDAAWPADQDSVLALTFDVKDKEPRKVILRSIRPPTPGRWSSFLWQCGPVKTRTVPQ
jgi:hypothetical protein